MPARLFNRGMIFAVGSVFAVALIAIPCLALGGQIDIQGPLGSGWFGNAVAVLPNGNIVVTDPSFSTSSANHAGAVYLYDPSGTLISALVGSSDGDNVGLGRIVVLANGHFVVSTPSWNNGSATEAGAVTWINADSGLSGVVSAANSLVGTSNYDHVGGYDDVVALSNGHYVVASTGWSNAGANNAGAVTWGDGNGGISGAVSVSNSLVGTEAQDSVGQDQNLFAGGVIALPNGNYVVPSLHWHYATRKNYGAITWGNGNGGTIGPVSLDNSLLETTDCISDTGGPSQITVLHNSNYLVASPCWNSDGVTDVGAVTRLDGSQPTSTAVSPLNSLIGTSSADRVGYFGVTVLSNGNFVIQSPNWNSGRGAATWIDGTNTAIAGVVSASNSLVGSTLGDFTGGSVTALINGHYVVGSWRWDSPDTANVGAATWADGTSGAVGPVSAANSLIGSSETDLVGFAKITALSNGNYVVVSPSWNDGPLNDVGAVTLLDGSGPTVGLVTSSNSVIGSHANDRIGGRGVTALPNGAFVIASPDWSNGGVPKAGAVTWADGTTMLTGELSSANSLVGTSANDQVGFGGVEVLTNGIYVVNSYQWNNGSTSVAGAATWADGSQGRSGDVSSANSLVGTPGYYFVGLRLTALADGNYLLGSSKAQSGYSIGTLTLVDGQLGASGTFPPGNTLFAGIGNATFGKEIAYDASRATLVVGRKSANIVTLFSINDSIFASGFE